MTKHWKAYLMEAAGLGGFVIGAGLLTIFLEHPDLPVMHSSLKDYPLLRRAPMGIIMGAYIWGITLLFGKKSGAHINPAATLTFLRIGKINFRHAVFYIISQFAGAVIAAHLLKYFIGYLFSHPLIDYGVAKPMPPHGNMAAFIAEFIISFILMLVVLIAASSKKFEKYIAALSGALIALYLIIEMPFSGMSLNPARSFAAALAANEWDHLWIYFIAPPAAMLIAAEIFVQWKNKKLIKADEDYKEIPTYPVEEKTI